VHQSIALVEGTGPKPFITAQQLGIITIRAAGGQFCSSSQTLWQILTGKQTLGRKVIQFYPDAVCNLHVLRQYRAILDIAANLG